MRISLSNAYIVAQRVVPVTDRSYQDEYGVPSYSRAHSPPTLVRFTADIAPPARAIVLLDLHSLGICPL